jgi:ribose transport system ATP-binding protein
MSTLSGGNQQKAIVAKWLQLSPGLLLLDEPTIGVDVGSRVQIFEYIRKLASGGTAVLCSSVDYAQLATLCDRVLIFSRGVVVDELVGPQVTKDEILTRCLLQPATTT